MARALARQDMAKVCAAACQVYIVRLIQLLLVAFCLGTLFVKPRMSTTTLQARTSEPIYDCLDPADKKTKQCVHCLGCVL